MSLDSFSEFVNQSEFVRLFFVCFILYALIGFKVIPDIMTIIRTGLLVFAVISVIWIIGNADYVYYIFRY